MSMTVIEKPAPPSPHRSRRPRPISAIVIHDTGATTAASTLAWFASPQSHVSAHVVIGTDGTIYRVVPDTDAAWHAGKSSLHGVENVNAFSLGVELVNDGAGNGYPEAQLAACAAWCAAKCEEYKIPLNRIVGHDQIARPVGRKRDPFTYPWREFLLRVARQ